MKASTFFKSLIIFFLVLLVGGAAGGLVTFGLLGSQNVKQSQVISTAKTDEEQMVLNQTQVKTATTEAVKTIQNAVVSVVNYKTQYDSDSIYSQIFGNGTAESTSGQLVVYGEGSGVIYKKDQQSAYVVTNTHVVEGAEKVEIILADGNRLDGELVGSDTYSDLAVIKISGEDITTIGQFADSASLTLGEPAIAIGSPLGSQYANSVTEGIVSGLSRTVTSANDYGKTISTNAIQTDAAINQGNSGGPLINIQGQIIGINSSKITLSRTQVAVEGMGFAIPSNDVIAIIKQLEEHGQVIRPAIGINMVSLAEVSSSIYTDLSIPEEITSGIIVSGVIEGMPAFGKLEVYDVITEVDSQEISSASDLQSILYKHQIGDTINVSFYRKGEKKTVDIELTKDNQELTASR